MSMAFGPQNIAAALYASAFSLAGALFCGLVVGVAALLAHRDRR
jgi:hypothetical protein